MDTSQWLPRIDRNACTGCGDCVAVCPTLALATVAGKADLVEPDACTYCTVCEDICQVDAIELPFLICKPNSIEADSLLPFPATHSQRRN